MTDLSIQPLLTPITLGDYKLKNRIIMSNDLVFKDRVSEDRRVVLIKLTEKGKKMQDKTINLNAITDKCCAELKLEDIKQLRNLLTRFNEQITG